IYETAIDNSESSLRSREDTSTVGWIGFLAGFYIERFPAGVAARMREEERRQQRYYYA
ncbi:hypothetical protein K0M31_016762, partial [Melipona bicolor]